ncbi:VOC family protein [Microbacterium sp.]|uniref:VOC family protein n=1 Tax=Microbacterium sp. TaxID=51671 RepID=UPI00281206DC|nr:VOC family protein [Microbacterium sp.]
MAHGDVTHLEIPVSDLESAKDFYADLFGWEISSPPGFEEYPMWRAPNKISGGALTPREEGFTQPRSIIEVDSIEDTLAKVTAGGGKVVQPRAPIDETSWWALFEDPDGNVIGLFEGSMQDG